MRVAALGVVLIVGLLSTAATAAPDPGKNSGKEKATGFITGRVTDDSGKPAAGAVAEAFSCADGMPARSAKADKSGDYRLGPLGDGCYRVRFDGDGYESTWIGEEGYREAAEDIEIAGNTVSGKDGSLTPASAFITGKVKGPGGKGLPGAWVTTWSQDENGYNISDGRTDRNGTYTVKVNPGKHVVMFMARGYVRKIHGSEDEPTFVEAAEGKKASGIDAVLAKGGKISGSVTDAAGNGLRGAHVVAIETERPTDRLTARTDGSGQFVLEGVPTGSYRIGFGDREKKYVPQWYDGKVNPSEAALVAVTAPGEVSGIRGVMRTAGGIAGKITDASGGGIAGAFVTAKTAGAVGRGGGAVTDETGAYTIGGLASGSYVITVNASRDSFVPLFYRDAADESSATPVEVAAPQITYGVDQVIQGASLAGLVRSSSGHPVEGVMVAVYRSGSETSGMIGISSTDPEGKFSISLPDGDYLLHFAANQGDDLPQWSGGGATRKEARPVTVARKEGVTKLEVVLPRGGSISGTVRNRTGAPLKGVMISSRNAATGEGEETTQTDEAGKYQISRLQGGSYRLVGDGSTIGYVREKVPQAVEVKPPAVTEGVDIVMNAGGAISGKVVDRGGNVLQGVTVTAFDPTTWDDVATATTDGAGAYSMGGLPEGKYRVRFEDNDSKFSVQWYPAKSRREESAFVNVMGTGTTTGINATMIAGVPLKGTVTDSAGTPLANADVEVYGRSEDEPFDKARTDDSGTFTVKSLAPGSYRVRFGHSTHVPRWYGGSDRRTAASLAVEPGMAPITISLAKAGGTFSGKLTNPEGQQIGQAWITAIDPATGAAIADERICECSGRFDTPVPAATYLLKVERHGFVTWFGGSTKDEAAQVPVFGHVAGLDMVIEDEKVKTGAGVAAAGSK